MKRAVKEPAIAAAKAYLEGNLKYFDPEEGLKESVAVEDRGTIELFNTIMAGEYPNLRFEQWCQKLVETGQHHSLGVLARHVTSLHLSDRPRMPVSLSNWLVVRTRDEGRSEQAKKRGPKPRKQQLRDVAIWNAVQLVMDDFGLKLSRNPVARDFNSACSIVSQALAELGHARTEDAVEKVFRKLEKRHGDLSEKLN